MLIHRSLRFTGIYLCLLNFVVCVVYKIEYHTSRFWLTISGISLAFSFSVLLSGEVFHMTLCVTVFRYTIQLHCIFA